MPLVDRQAIRTDIGRITDWLITGTTDGVGAGDGSTIVDTGLYSKARDQHVRNRSIVAIVEGNPDQRGERRYATGPPSTAGVLTVSPVFGGEIASGIDYEIWDADGPHPDDIDRAIDRALADACWYWRTTPLTDMQGGDVGDELVLDGNNIDDDLGRQLFTATDVTTTLPELDPPDEFARRIIRATATASPGYLEALQIDVDPDNRSGWRIESLMRASSGSAAGGDARLVLYDQTNSVVFAANTDPLKWTRRGWGLLESGFTVPATCEAFSVRLQVQTSTQVGDFAWVQVWQQNQTRFSLPRRVASKRRVGPVFERTGTKFGQFARREWRGNLERREAMGRGVSLVLRPSPGSRSLWFYEKTPFPALTSSTPAATDDDAQTWAAVEWIRTAALAECYRFLWRRDRKEYPQRWVDEREDAEAELQAIQAEYGIEMLMTEDSPRPIGSAVVKV